MAKYKAVRRMRNLIELKEKGLISVERFDEIVLTKRESVVVKAQQQLAKWSARKGTNA